MKTKLILITLATVFLTSCGTSPQDSRPPNIILFFVDDLGYGDLGCFGQQLIRTPRLDRMAGEGIRMTSFYTASPVCAPSRCSLLTGKHGGHAQIRHNMNLTEGGQLPLPDKEVTMAELLQKAGYTTSAIGKWSLGTPGNEGNPMKQGFDHFFGYYCQCMAHNYYPELVWRNRDPVKLSNKTVPVQVNWADFPLSYATEKVENSALLALEEALVFIENNREAPFFLYYASTLPHSNGEAPPDERFEVPGWGIYTDSSWTPVDKGYASMVSLIDSQMASILDKLEQLEIDEHTLVIFTSDNGPTKFAARFNSSGPYRGRKRDLYEGGIRVPLIAWWPGQISSGRESSEIAASYDLFATICDAAGIQEPVQGDGRSLLPHWRGEDEGGREFLYWEIWEGPNAPKQAVRVGNWKLIAHFFPHPDKRYVELYNLKQDPGEKNNLADMFPEKVMELKKILAREHEPYVHSAIAAR